MARRPKNKSLLEIAITGDWKVSAIFAAALCIIIFVVIPTVTNPMLRPVALGLKPIGLFLAAIFGIVALVKVMLLKNSKSPSKSSLAAPTSDSSLISKTTFDAPITGVLGNPIERSTVSPPTVWSLKLIQDIEWKVFEDLSTAYYQEKGIRAEATSLGADGGIDIKLYQDETGNPTAIVQCKAWSNKQVGVKEIREFLGVMTHQKIAKGFYMTSGEYSSDAKETASANKITLINGEMLLAMIKRLSDASQQKLLTLATTGDYTTPSCSACGVKMVKRKGKRGEFWGCSSYPRCRQMLHVKSAS